MHAIADYIDRRFRRRDASAVFGLPDLSVLMWGRRSRYVGVVLAGDVLTIDYKAFSTFRVRLANVVSIPYPVRCYTWEQPPFDCAYLTRYFTENQDNPYGLWNLLLTSLRSTRPEGLTQFPPLLYPKDASTQAAAIDRMRDLALPGDAFFTYDRTSGLSRLIRSWDQGMWSHCGMVGHDETLLEMTTSGPLKSDFSSLCEPNLDVGLYRIRRAITDDQRHRAVEGMESMFQEMPRYSWFWVIRVALAKKFHIPFRRGPDEHTPAEIMYGNALTLVCYA